MLEQAKMCGVWAILGQDLPAETVCACVRAIRARGPDASRVVSVAGADCGKGEHRPFTFGFTRLATNGLTDAGVQPFCYTPPPASLGEPPGGSSSRCPGVWAICNAEIYNYKRLAAHHAIPLLQGSSDCQPLPQLYHQVGGHAGSFARALDGVFAIVLLDEVRGRVVAIRDPFGVRPLFIGHTHTGAVLLCSELKGLMPVPGLARIECMQPGTSRAWDCSTGVEIAASSAEGVQAGLGPYFTPHWAKNPCYGPSDAGRASARAALRVSLDAAVRKRLLVSDVAVGCLLSGGLDSSLVAALAQRAALAEGRPPTALHTFSIGMAGSSDLAHARLVAAHIGSTHHEVVLTAAQFLEAIPAVVRDCETFDITTVRASVGNYLVSKYIAANTDVVVVLNGDGSDEASGSYLYFFNAPSDEAFEGEVGRLLADISMYDVLRSDRSVASHGLEARTPFLDRQFVATYCSVDTAHRRPVRVPVLGADGKVVVRPAAAEKQLLREAFDPSYTKQDVDALGEESACPLGELHHLPQGQRARASANLHQHALPSGFPTQLLPAPVLWRRKEAFSDGVSSPEKSWYEVVQEHAAAQFHGGEAEWRAGCASYPPGPTAPYTAESLWYRRMFEQHYGQVAVGTIPYFWLPRWSGDAKDPSARTLAVYASTSASLGKQGQPGQAGEEPGPAMKMCEGVQFTAPDEQQLWSKVTVNEGC